MALAAPSALVATANGSEQVDLTWTNNDSYSKVQIARKEAGGNWGIIAQIGGTNESYSYTGLKHGVQYYYKVRGKSGVAPDEEYSSYSNEDDATTVLPAPTGLKATLTELAADLIYIKVEWTNNSDQYENIVIEPVETPVILIANFDLFSLNS